MSEMTDEGVVRIENAMIGQAGDQHRRRGEPKGGGEAFLALRQRDMRASPVLEIDEREEHASLVSKLDGLAGDDHQSPSSVSEAQLRFGLRNGATSLQMADRLLTSFGSL